MIHPLLFSLWPWDRDKELEHRYCFSLQLAQSTSEVFRDTNLVYETQPLSNQTTAIIPFNPAVPVPPLPPSSNLQSQPRKSHLHSTSAL
jgi:hypothetical protein